MVRKVHVASTTRSSEVLESYFQPVGVYIKRPEASKRSTEQAIAAIDMSAFDVHDEAFEL